MAGTSRAEDEALRRLKPTVEAAALHDASSITMLIGATCRRMKTCPEGMHGSEDATESSFSAISGKQSSCSFPPEVLRITLKSASSRIDMYARTNLLCLPCTRDTIMMCCIRLSLF